MRAPAATTLAMLLRSMPPSISIGAGLPARSSSARTSRTLASLRGMNVWPPNPGVDRHHEHVVDVAGDLLDRDDRRRRIEHDARLGAERLDGVHRAMQVRQHLDVHRDHRGAGLGERVDVAIGVGDHQVDVERHRRDALERRTTGGPMVMFGTKWPSMTST